MDSTLVDTLPWLRQLLGQPTLDVPDIQNGFALIQLLSLIEPSTVDLGWYATDGPSRCPNLPLRNFTALSKGIRMMFERCSTTGKAPHLSIPESVMRAAKAGEGVACEYILNALVTEYRRRKCKMASPTPKPDGQGVNTHKSGRPYHHEEMLSADVSTIGLEDRMDERYDIAEVSFRGSVRWLFRFALSKGTSFLTPFALQQLSEGLQILEGDVVREGEHVLRDISEVTFIIFPPKMESNNASATLHLISDLKDPIADMTQRMQYLDTLMSHGYLNFKQSLRQSVRDMVVDDNPVYETIHSNIIDALMLAATTAPYPNPEAMIPALVQHLSEKFPRFDPHLTYPYDLEDALLIWVNQCIASNETLRNKGSELEEFAQDMGDGAGLLAILLAYLPPRAEFTAELIYIKPSSTDHRVWNLRIFEQEIQHFGLPLPPWSAEELALSGAGWAIAENNGPKASCGGFRAMLIEYVGSLFHHFQNTPVSKTPIPFSSTTIEPTTKKEDKGKGMKIKVSKKKLKAVKVSSVRDEIIPVLAAAAEASSDRAMDIPAKPFLVRQDAQYEFQTESTPSHAILRSPSKSPIHVREQISTTLLARQMAQIDLGANENAPNNSASIPPLMRQNASMDIFNPPEEISKMVYADNQDSTSDRMILGQRLLEAHDKIDHPMANQATEKIELLQLPILNDNIYASATINHLDAESTTDLYAGPNPILLKESELSLAPDYVFGNTRHLSNSPELQKIWTRIESIQEQHSSIENEVYNGRQRSQSHDRDFAPKYQDVSFNKDKLNENDTLPIDVVHKPELVEILTNTEKSEDLLQMQEETFVAEKENGDSIQTNYELKDQRCLKEDSCTEFDTSKTCEWKNQVAHEDTDAEATLRRLLLQHSFGESQLSNVINPLPPAKTSSSITLENVDVNEMSSSNSKLKSKSDQIIKLPTKIITRFQKLEEHRQKVYQKRKEAQEQKLAERVQIQEQQKQQLEERIRLKTQASEEQLPKACPHPRIRLKVAPSELSNRHLIKNALQHVCLAGSANERTKNEVLQELEESPAKNFIILFKDFNNFSFRGLYAWDPLLDSTIKIYSGSQGPDVLDTAMVLEYYKYDSGARTFKSLSTKSFGRTVCAVAIPRDYAGKNKNTYIPVIDRVVF